MIPNSMRCASSSRGCLVRMNRGLLRSVLRDSFEHLLAYFHPVGWQTIRVMASFGTFMLVPQGTLLGRAHPRGSAANARSMRGVGSAPCCNPTHAQPHT